MYDFDDILRNNYFGGKAVTRTVLEMKMKIGMGRMGMSFPYLLYVDDLVLCGESEEGLKMMVRCFVEVCRKRSLKVTVDKTKVTVLGGEEGMVCEVLVDGI